LKVNDWIGSVISTNQPTLSTAAPQQGTEIVSANQDAAVFCQGDHLLWGRGGIEDPLKLKVAIHQVAKVIQGIQQQWRGAVHPGRSSEGTIIGNRVHSPTNNFTRAVPDAIFRASKPIEVQSNAQDQNQECSSIEKHQVFNTPPPKPWQYFTTDCTSDPQDPFSGRFDRFWTWELGCDLRVL
jgi:hypothetical protein